MKIKNLQIKRVLSTALLVLLMVAGMTKTNAQTIVNADFESGNTGFLTDYVYMVTGGVQEGHYCVDATSSGHGTGSIGWPTILGYGGSGKYMLVNGFGGTINPTKVVWKQTVNVTPNTDYIFSCQVVNLAQSFFGYSPNPTILRLKINGSMVGGDYTVAQNNSWHEWSVSWSNGSATQAEIAIYDVYTGDSGLGDDFGLDHLSLSPQTTVVPDVTGELDYTTYDWQSNAGAITRTIVWPDGKVNFAYTMATNEYYGDRGTGIGTYDVVNDQWIPSNGRIENEKTGFGSIARYGQNGIVVAAHTAVQCGIYIIDDKDNIIDNSVPVASILDNRYEPTWPNVMTSGPNRDIIHVVATAYTNNSIPGMENVNQPILYFRSQDGGETWDVQNFILPFMDANYGLSWGSNVCYWMETTEDNCLALVVNNPWSDGMVIYSYDNGDTWERKVFYKHPNPFGIFDNMFLYPRWTSCQWDNQHHLHVLYEFTGCSGTPESNNSYPGVGGVAYWNETMLYNENGTTQSAVAGNLTPGQAFVLDSAYLYNDIYASWWLWSDASHEMWPEYIGYLPPLDDNGNWEDPYQATQFNIADRSLHGNYHSSVCGFPVLCKVPGSDDMVAVWCAMDENNTDENGNYYYKLFSSYSNDGGNHWTDMVHLTNSSYFQSKECVYPQAAVVNNQLVIACQMDDETGSFVMGDDSDASNNYYQGLTFDLGTLVGAIPITATANPTEGGSITGAGIYEEGAVCTMTAIANSGYYFLNWTEDGNVVSTDLEYSFVVTESRNLVANFITNHWTATDNFQYNMFVIGVVMIDSVEQASATLELGAFCNGECRGTEFPVYDGGQWLYFMTICGNSGEDITFRLYDHVLQQENQNCINVIPFEVYGLIGVDDPYEVYFSSSRIVSASVNPENAGIVAGAGEYALGTEVILTASANPGYYFVNWTENGVEVSSDTEYSFIITENRNLVANFISNHWITSNFQNNMSMIGIVQIDGTEQASPMLELGAFCNGECRGTAFPVEDGDRWLYFMTIGGNDGEDITFRLYDHALQQELNLFCYNVIPFETSGLIGMDEPYEVQFYNWLTVSATIHPENAGTVSGTGEYGLGANATLTATANEGYAFNSWTLNGEIVSTEPSYTFTVSESVNLTANFDFVHTQQLATGWNWWSTYIEQDGIDGLAMLENSLSESGNVIKSQNAYIEYNGQVGVWAGSLSSIVNEQSYMIEVTQDCNSYLAGALVQPENHPITLQPGWNWIGYPVTVQQTAGLALANLQPLNNDVIKGQSSFAMYRTNRWLPVNFRLEPGKGYMYFSGASEAKTLVYAQGRREVLPAVTEECYWNANRHVFVNNICLLAMVEVDGMEQRDETIELGAFVNGECRGSAHLYYIESIDHYVAFLIVSGQDGEQVEFRLMNEREATVLMSNEHITFHNDAIVGNLDQPFTVHFDAMNGLSEMNTNMHIYPNPIDRNAPFTLAVPEDEIVVDILINNTLGEVVRHDTGSLSATMTSGLPVVGVYLVKVRCKSGNVYQGRMVVK